MTSPPMAKQALDREDALARAQELIADIRALVRKAKPRKDMAYRDKVAFLLGGPGSGNFGHEGRPGEVGGSATVAEISDRDRRKNKQFREMMEHQRQRLAREKNVAARGPVEYRHNKATHAEVTARLKTLVPKSSVEEGNQVAATAASHAADVLEEMAAKGYELPESVSIRSKSDRMGVGGEVVFQLGSRHLSINLPTTLPAEANLDDAVLVGFGGKTPEGDDNFATKTMNEVVVHEMGHVQAGNRAGRGRSGLSALAVQAFPTKKAQKAAMLQVSKYAAKNVDEFLAEAFVKLYRGETLPREAQALYNALNGPKVRE